MATKQQLNKKVKQLETKLEVQKHEANYIHIPKPSWKGIGKFFLTILLGFLSYFNFKLILKIFQDYNLDYVFANSEEFVNYAPKFADLIVLYPLIGQYILISLTVLCFVWMFKKLNSYKESGLIIGLIFGLIFGLSLGLIGGLIGGLIFGLSLGLIIGLSVEFSKTSNIKKGK